MQAALLVIDVQVGVVANAWQRDRVVANVALAVQRARAAAVPVLWVQHESDQFPANSAPWQWVPELQPLPGEARLHKHYNSAFEDTGLTEQLDALGVCHLFLAGAATNWCIRATAYAALERGFDVTLLADAHTTDDMVLDGGQVVPAQAVVADLNAALRWLVYPGRRNGVAPAATAGFGAAP